MVINSLAASVWRSAMPFTNSLDLDEAKHNVEPLLNSKLFDTQIKYQFLGDTNTFFLTLQEKN